MKKDDKLKKILDCELFNDKVNHPINLFPIGSENTIKTKDELGRTIIN